MNNVNLKFDEHIYVQQLNMNTWKGALKVRISSTIFFRTNVHY